MTNTGEWIEVPTLIDDEDCVRTEVFRTRRRRYRNLVLGGGIAAGYVALVALTLVVVRALSAVLP